MKIAYLVTIMIFLGACGNLSIKRKKHEGNGNIPSIPHPPELEPYPNKSGLQHESYPSCAPSLVNGVLSDKIDNLSLPSKTILLRYACEVMGSFGENDERWDVDCATSGDDHSIIFNIDTILQKIPIGTDASYLGGLAQPFCKNPKARGYRHVWYKKMCGLALQPNDLVRATHQTLFEVSESIQKEWMSCMTKQHSGLLCVGDKLEDKLQLNIDYYSNRYESDDLDVKFVYSGVNPLSQLPSQLKPGSSTVEFLIDNNNDDASIRILNKKDGSTQVACDYQLPAQEPLTCDGANIVGRISGSVRYQKSALCNQVDHCELTRLRALFHGRIDRDVYNDLVADGWGAYIGSNGAMAMGPCEL